MPLPKLAEAVRGAQWGPMFQEVHSQQSMVSIVQKKGLAQEIVVPPNSRSTTGMRSCLCVLSLVGSD